MDTQIAQRIEDRINECFMKVLGRIPQYSVVYRSIGRGVAGMYQHGIRRLTFDPWYADRYTEHYIQQTVAHEVAHAICYLLYPNAKQSHGPEWRSIMRALGVPASTYHNYQTEGAPGVHARNYQYTCGCEGRVYNLTSRMHNTIMGGAGRRCKFCKTSVTFLGVKA